MKIIGHSETILHTKELILQVCKTTASVMITGESGTGKELVAREIHANSNRSRSPFIAVNCGAIPNELLESELFGHEKGAFTGAITQRIGRFELADGGTIFLDEIGDMPIQMQVKLLRVLQEKKIEKIGSNKSIDIDVRIIAATHQDLESLIEENKFREDLYYRLNIFPINLSPLRERKDDIPLLIEHFLGDEKETYEISDKAKNLLCLYKWPGNIRELSNIIERAKIISTNNKIDDNSLPDKIKLQLDKKLDFNKKILECKPDLLQKNFNMKEHMTKIETELLKEALKISDGTTSHAASILGVQRTTLVEKLKKYNINK